MTHSTVLLLAATLALAGCTTTATAPAAKDEGPARHKSEPGRKSVGSNIRKRAEQPTVAATGRIDGESYSQQMRADQVNPTGEQIINSRNQ